MSSSIRIFRQSTVAIVIPTYNRSKLLISLLKQINMLISSSHIFKEFFSVTVLDNASEDHGYEIVGKLCRELNFSYYRAANNVGSSGNFSRAYACSSSAKYLWILSDDEILKEFSLLIIYKLLCKVGKQPSIVCFNSYQNGFPFVGTCKDWIFTAIHERISVISAVTLISSVIFERRLFCLDTFWHYEGHWFPHSYAVFGTAISLDVNIVVLHSFCYIVESGNTAEERFANKDQPSISLLNLEFQTACLDFINFCLVLAGLSQYSAQKYVDSVSLQFSVPSDIIWKGMKPIDNLLLKSA